MYCYAKDAAELHSIEVDSVCQKERSTQQVYLSV